MHRVEVYVLLNISCISSLICSRGGHTDIESTEKYKKIFQVIIYLKTVAFGGWNKNNTCDRVNSFFKQLE